MVWRHAGRGRPLPLASARRRHAPIRRRSAAVRSQPRTGRRRRLRRIDRRADTKRADGERVDHEARDTGRQQRHAVVPMRAGVRADDRRRVKSMEHQVTTSLGRPSVCFSLLWREGEPRRALCRQRRRASQGLPVDHDLGRAIAPARGVPRSSFAERVPGPTGRRRFTAPAAPRLDPSLGPTVARQPGHPGRQTPVRAPAARTADAAHHPTSRRRTTSRGGGIAARTAKNSAPRGPLSVPPGVQGGGGRPGRSAALSPSGVPVIRAVLINAR